VNLIKLFTFLFPLLRLTLWAAGDGDPGASESDPPAGEAGDTDPPTGGAPQPGDDRRFSQADLNRLTGKARREALASWAKENGFADVKDLEGLIKAKKEADDKAKDDLTKATERADREATRAEAAEKRLYDIVLKFGFQLAAVDQVGDVELAYLAAQSLGLLNGEGPVEVDLEAVEVKGMDEVIKKLLSKKPLLKKQAALGQPAGTGGAAGGNSTPPGQMSEAEQARIRREYGIR
jgi:hypothetical protein